jgi:crotonobetainyl-CoA:carnitine CoA-transferase CaiB-like acyl-CoA transferase
MLTPGSDSEIHENPRVLPLDGIKVYEFGCNLAGPYAGWVLAELGANVIKIERPEGDDARTWGPPFWDGAATIFHTVNRNKQSISLDLKNAQVAAELRRRIIDEADVVLQNLRPGVASDLGFSAEALTAVKPTLIYCNLHAFGARGPMKDLPGYDTLIQAFGGIMSVTGEDGGPPVRAGVSVIDIGAGMWCCIGILTALYHRGITGKGCVVDASLFETALGWMSWHAAGFQASHELPGRRATGARGITPYQAFACSDGPLIVAASNDRLFAKLARVLGHPEWLEDDRFSTNPRRVVNSAALVALIEPIMIAAPRAEWQKKLDDAGVPNAPIQDIAEVLAHPQTAALDIAQPTGDDRMKLIGLPVSFDGSRPPLRNLAPPLGAGNDEWAAAGDANDAN